MNHLRTPRLAAAARRASVLLAAVAAIVSASAARAEVSIDITRGTVAPLPIAIMDFTGAAPGALPDGGGSVESDLPSVVAADLERSGLFAPIAASAFIQDHVPMNTLPRFGDWRVVSAQALVTGAVLPQPDGQIRVEFRLWDVLAERQMLGQAFIAAPDSWRRMAHMVADAIYKRLTGEDGYFDSRIVYVAESGPKRARVKRLAVMDQDGAGHRFLTDGDALVLTPRFSPRRHEITYLSYFNGEPRVYLFDMLTGRQELLGAFPGMTFAPRFSPDGNAVVMSHAERGNSDVHLMDLRTRRPLRLTDDPGIDTSPSFSPDGKRIVFNSDRGGVPQLYVMNADGSAARRISFGRGVYATPVWSPRGDLIAFTKQREGRFHIGVMRPDGSGERLLTESFLDEGPTWSPNGRVILFFRQEKGVEGRTRLYSIDVTGGNLREIITPGDASDPAWSPLNP